MVKEGFYYGFALSGAACLITYLSNGWWSAPLFVAAAFCFYFFRDPERTIPDGPVAVSPADGKVVQVRTMEDGRQRVSIFLNIFDVHVNRMPVAGEIVDQHYQRGRFRLAHLDAASVENEQNTLTIDSDGKKITVKQIAGLVARRIVCHKRVGDQVGKGERFGLIKFGSRVDVFLGPEWDLLVRSGDKIRGGSSVLARRRTEAS